MTKTHGEKHPRGALARLIAGEAGAVQSRRAVRHLLRGCDDCRRDLPAPRGAAAATGDLKRAFDRAVARVEALSREVAAEQAEGAEVLARLNGLTPPQQRLLLENSAGARTRAVCEGLIELARAQRTRDAHEARRLAELAVLVGEALPAPGDASARAWAELGNAHRICGDLAAAGEALATAWELSEEYGIDPLVEAEILALRASFEGYRRNFDRALDLGTRAMRIFRTLGDEASVARCLVRLGDLHAKRGDPEAGLAVVRQAIDMLGSAPDSELKLAAVHNLCHLTLEAGHARAAARLLADAAPLYERIGSPLDLLRRDWLRGKIARELGRLADAEQILDRVRGRYSELGLGYAWAVASLDLSAVYARLGHRSRLALLAQEMMPVFRSLRVPRETIATLSLLALAEAEEAVALAAKIAAVVEGTRRERPAGAPPTRG